MRTSSPPSLSITCVAMDNVGRILKDRHISVNGLLALIHDRHPDCGLPYSILRRLVSHERKMSIDEAILICDALNIPFTALFDFAGEVPHGPLKGMTSADIYRACDAAGTWHTIGNVRDWENVRERAEEGPSDRLRDRGYTRIVRHTVSSARYERTLVCCLKTHIMHRPVREPRRLAPTLGTLALACRPRTGLPRQTTRWNSPRNRFREKSPTPKSSIVCVNTILGTVVRWSISRLISYPPGSVPFSRPDHSRSYLRRSCGSIVIFSMECSRMIGLDGGDGSI